MHNERALSPLFSAECHCKASGSQEGRISTAYHHQSLFIHACTSTKLPTVAVVKILHLHIHANEQTCIYTQHIKDGRFTPRKKSYNLDIYLLGTTKHRSFFVVRPLDGENFTFRDIRKSSHVSHRKRNLYLEA